MHISHENSLGIPDICFCLSNFNMFSLGIWLMLGFPMVSSQTKSGLHMLLFYLHFMLWSLFLWINTCLNFCSSWLYMVDSLACCSSMASIPIQNINMHMNVILNSVFSRLCGHDCNHINMHPSCLCLIPAPFSIPLTRACGIQFDLFMLIVHWLGQVYKCHCWL